MRRALGQKHSRLRMIDDRNQHGRRANRLLARKDREHLVGALIAACGNEVRISQACGNLELQPLSGPGEKLGGTECGGTVPRHCLVQCAPLTCSASAMAKNAPPDATPNI